MNIFQLYGALKPVESSALNYIWSSCCFPGSSLAGGRSLSLSLSVFDRPPLSSDVTRALGNAAEVDLAVFTAKSDFISGLHHIRVPIRATGGIGAGGAA